MCPGEQRIKRTLNQQGQETIVEERGKELFGEHTGQFLLFAVSFLGKF